MRIPERLVGALVLTGCGLGLLGLLTLFLFRPPDSSSCGRDEAVSGPKACETPYRVVRYKLETQVPSPTPLPRPVPAMLEPSIHASVLGDRILPLMPVTPLPVLTVKSRLDRPAFLSNLLRAAGLISFQRRANFGVAIISSLSDVDGRVREPAFDLAQQAAAFFLTPTPVAKAVLEAGDRPEPAPESSAEAAAPAASARCPTTSTAHFDLIPVDGPGEDHPDAAHGDLNLALRGYEAVQEALGLVDYNGPADPDAPRLASLLDHSPAIQSVYRARQWRWDPGGCAGQPHGCAGTPIADWPVTVAGFATTAGEAVYVPRRSAQIYSGGYVALVLFADTTQITIGYTRRDSVAAGYVIHLENVCVDPALLALYRDQNNPAGWRSSHSLPGLQSGQVLGTARGSEIQVAIRDGGNFLDPRSRKDWWQ